MEEAEFVGCYRRMIACFCLTPEESDRQFAEILRRMRTPDAEKDRFEDIDIQMYPIGGAVHEDQTANAEF